MVSAIKPMLTPFTWRRDLAKAEPAPREMTYLTERPPQAVAANLAKIGHSGESSGGNGEEK